MKKIIIVLSIRYPDGLKQYKSRIAYAEIHFSLQIIEAGSVTKEGSRLFSQPIGLWLPGNPWAGRVMRGMNRPKHTPR